MSVTCIGWSTVTLVPISYVNGPVPVRPSCVDSDTFAGSCTTEWSEHGHVAVENDQVAADASGVPSIAFTPVVTVAVYDVEPVSIAVGVSEIVFVESLYETVAATGLPPVGASVTVVDVTVAGSTDRERTAVIVGVRETFDAPFAGVVDVTDGGGGGVVGTEKLQEYGVPSVAPSVAATVPFSRAVYVAPAVSAADGVNVAVRLGLS